MNEHAKALIDEVEAEARKGAVQDEQTILQLVKLESTSEATAYLIERARAFALEVTGGKARIAGAIGVDLAPCKMNCKFCSFGDEWGLVREKSILSKEQVVEMARAYVEAGVSMVTLRTTEFYDLNVINDWVRAIRESVPGVYEINLNVGELTPEMCNACYEAGVSSAYHVLRMREGIDTPFDPEVRKRTIRTIVDSPLKWNTCIEPIGREHTDEEIAERMAFVCSLRPHSIGIMPRVPVPGTPLGDIPMLDRQRMRHLVAILRLAAGSTVPYVTMHPDDALGLEAGTNGFSVERGAVPRDTKYSDGEWRGLTAARAVEILRESGYEVGILNCDPRFKEGARWWSPRTATAVETPSYIGDDDVEYLRGSDGPIPLKLR